MRSRAAFWPVEIRAMNDTVHAEAVFKAEAARTWPCGMAKKGCDSGIFTPFLHQLPNNPHLLPTFEQALKPRWQKALSEK